MCVCDRAAELLSRRLDGDELTEAERVFLDGHLADCPDCRALASQFDMIHAAMPSLEVEPPANLKDEVLARIAEEERAEKVVAFPAKRRSPWKRWAAMAAVFAVVLLGAGPIKDGLTSPMADPGTAPRGLEETRDMTGAPAAYGNTGSTDAPDVGVHAVNVPGADTTPAPRGVEPTADGSAPTSGDNAVGLPLTITFTHAPEPTAAPETKSDGPDGGDKALARALEHFFPETGALPEGWDASCVYEDGDWTITLTAPDGTQQTCRVLETGTLMTEGE